MIFYTRTKFYKKNFTYFCFLRSSITYFCMKSTKNKSELRLQMILAFACPSISEAHYSCNTACLAIFYIAYIFSRIFPNTAGNDFFVHCISSARDNHVLKRKFLSDIFVYVVVFIKKKAIAKNKEGDECFRTLTFEETQNSQELYFLHIKQFNIIIDFSKVQQSKYF